VWWANVAQHVREMRHNVPTSTSERAAARDGAVSSLATALAFAANEQEHRDEHHRETDDPYGAGRFGDQRQDDQDGHDAEDDGPQLTSHPYSLVTCSLECVWVALRNFGPSDGLKGAVARRSIFGW